MVHVPGTASAAVLARLGLTRTEIIRALIREIGLSEAEAEAAWWSTEPGQQQISAGRPREISLD